MLGGVDADPTYLVHARALGYSPEHARPRRRKRDDLLDMALSLPFQGG
jgi:hypothetical protein